MNILLIHQAFTTNREPSGTRHLELGQQLAAFNDQMTVVASQITYATGKRVRGRRRGLYFGETAGNVRVLRAFAPVVVQRNYIWRIVAFLVFSTTSAWAGLRAGPTDVVMGTSPPIFQAFSAWAVARLRRKPYLLEVRDLWPAFAIDMGILRNPIAIWLSQSMERFLYRHADHLIVNSPAYSAYLIERGVPSARISLVPNGVDCSMFDPNAHGDAIRAKFAPSEDSCLAVYAGAHGVANDLDTILEAAVRLRDRQDIHFLMVGDGKERPRLEASARRHNLTNITFVGPVPKSEMPGVLAAADVCIATLRDIPMFTMTYPNKVFDYMASGRPTVLAIDGVIRDVLEAANGGVFVPPGDSEALAAAICQLAANPQERKDMGMRARNHVVQHFDRKDQARAFRSVLDKLVRGNYAAARNSSEGD